MFISKKQEEKEKEVSLLSLRDRHDTTDSVSHSSEFVALKIDQFESPSLIYKKTQQIRFYFLYLYFVIYQMESKFTKNMSDFLELIISFSFVGEEKVGKLLLNDPRFLVNEPLYQSQFLHFSVNLRNQAKLLGMGPDLALKNKLEETLSASYRIRLADFMNKYLCWAPPIRNRFLTMSELKSKALSLKKNVMDYDIILFDENQKLLSDRALGMHIEKVLEEDSSIPQDILSLLRYSRATKKNEENQKPYGFPHLVFKELKLEGSNPLKCVAKKKMANVVSLKLSLRDSERSDSLSDTERSSTSLLSGSDTADSKKRGKVGKGSESESASFLAKVETVLLTEKASVLSRSNKVLSRSDKEKESASFLAEVESVLLTEKGELSLCDTTEVKSDTTKGGT